MCLGHPGTFLHLVNCLCWGFLVQMIQIKPNFDYFLVNNSFVDKYMCEANGSFIKVYLYLLRHSSRHDLEISDIANALNLLESDVIRAFKYWSKRNLISFTQHSEKDFDVEFIEENQKDLETECETEISNQEKTVVRHSSVPTGVNYSKSDINTYMRNNDGIKHMFLISEQLLSKNLTDTDRRILFSFYDYLGMPIEVIFTLLEYCISIGKTNMRYIEKVAYSWADKGINTLAKASLHVKEENEVNNTFKRFKIMFKINGREFTPSEEGFIKDWVYNHKFSDDMIAQAYEKAVANTGKISFKYMDAVLKNTSSGPAYSQSTKQSYKQPEKKNFFQDYDDELSDFEIQMMRERINRN